MDIWPYIAYGPREVRLPWPIAPVPPGAPSNTLSSADYNRLSKIYTNDRTQYQDMLGIFKEVKKGKAALSKLNIDLVAPERQPKLLEAGKDVEEWIDNIRQDAMSRMAQIETDCCSLSRHEAAATYEGCARLDERVECRTR